MTEEQPKPAEPVQATPAPEPVKQPEPVKDNTQELLQKVMKEIEVEDSKRTEVLTTEYKKQLEEVKKSLQETYDSKFNELHKKLDEYSGRKGVVDSNSVNPLVEKVTPQVQEKIAPNSKLDKKTDYELAQQFIGNIKK